jgi:hypothetical protein
MRARLGLAGCVVAMVALASASGAAASTTIGQLAPDGGSGTTCAGGPYDFLQPPVTAGNTYVVPAGGDVISSWSTNAIAGVGQMLEMKVYRKVSDPMTYKVIGHDGPRPLIPSKLNTFAVSIAVQPGDVLGLNSANAGSVTNECVFTAPGQTYDYFLGDLGDGTSGAFTSGSNARLNITAVVAAKPLNTFSFGKLNRNKKKGTATVPVFVPGPGSLSLTGKNVKTQRAAGGAAASLTVPGAGMVKLLVKPKGKLKKKLRKKGTARVRIRVTYTPTGDLPGVPNTQTEKIKLNKKR